MSVDWGLPACSQASLEGVGALSRGSARRKLLQHHFPYLVFLFEVISGKYDMAEHAGALWAHWALGIFGWTPLGWPRLAPGAPSLRQEHTRSVKERLC